jgi:hypothetical protein
MGELLNQRCDEWDMLTKELELADQALVEAEARRNGAVLSRIAFIQDTGFDVHWLQLRDGQQQPATVLEA